VNEAGLNGEIWSLSQPVASDLDQRAGSTKLRRDVRALAQTPALSLTVVDLGEASCLILLNLGMHSFVK
jgi:hypothetical protein